MLGAGQIGSAVLKAAPSGHEVIVRTHAQLDIVDAQAVAQALADDQTRLDRECGSLHGGGSRGGRTGAGAGSQ